MSDGRLRRAMSPSIIVGLGAVGMGTAYLGGSILLGLDVCMLLVMVAVPALLIGWVVVAIGLVVKVWRHRSFPFAHLAVLLLISAMVCFGSGAQLLNYHTQLVVARTGGKARLQAWAVDVLAKPRELMQSGPNGTIPEEYWSDEVRRLHSFPVRVGPVFNGKQDVVWLSYGRTFWHWSVVIGPPGFAPDSDEVSRRGSWLRWGDGIYDYWPD